MPLSRQKRSNWTYFFRHDNATHVCMTHSQLGLVQKKCRNNNVLWNYVYVKLKASLPQARKEIKKKQRELDWFVELEKLTSWLFILDYLKVLKIITLNGINSTHKQISQNVINRFGRFKIFSLVPNYTVKEVNIICIYDQHENAKCNRLKIIIAPSMVTNHP